MAARHILWVCLFFSLTVFHSQPFAAEPIPGHIIAWGINDFGQTTVPPDLNDVIAVAAGPSHNLALRANGTVVFWGEMTRGPVPPGLSNVVAIAVGFHSVALKSDGTVVIWGTPNADLSTIPPSASNIMAIGAAQGATVALRHDGSVIAWGWDQQLTTLPANLSNVVRIWVGPNHAWAQKADGSFVGWGNNFYGQATLPPGLSGIRSIEAGQFTSLAVKSDFTIHRWGGPDENEVPPGINGVSEVQAGNQHAVALRTNGTVVAWGYNAQGQGSVPEEITGVTTFSVGGNHNLVVTARPRFISLTPPVHASVGERITFTVSAAGGPLTYQWQYRGTNLPNETNSSLSISAASENAGPYAVIVSNAYGYLRRTTELILPPPAITAQPVNREVYRSETVTFSVTVSGLPPLTYQWWHNGTNRVGANSATLSLPAIDSPQVGTYHVVVTDVTGTSVQSAAATLKMLDPRLTTITIKPVVDTSIHSGGAKPQGTSTLLVGLRGVNITDRALIRFDLSQIPANAVVRSAELKLIVVRAPNALPYTFHLHRMLTPWAEGADWSLATATVPWAAPGTQAGSDYLTNSATAVARSTVDGFFALFTPSASLQDDVQTWIQRPASNHGWIVISEGENVLRSARHLGSSESQFPPQLTLTYEIPSPVPTLTQPGVTDGKFNFQSQPTAGWFYTVETREHLDRGDWIVITNMPGGDGRSLLNFSTPATNGHQFFRSTRH
jgi:hypothetical protein